MTESKLTMKLLIHGPSNKVLFAEAGKEVVDFLFSLLAMPVGTIVKLLSKDNMVGCIGSLYKSLEGMEETYLHSSHSKSALLNPTVHATSLPCNLLLPGEAAARRYYKCYNCSCFTNVKGTTCSNCKNQMITELKYVDPHVGNALTPGGGYVKDVVTYTVMDDLTVTPMSSISSITLLNKFNVKDLASLQEKTVSLGIKEGLELLKASLQSKAVLTETFLGKKRAT